MEIIVGLLAIFLLLAGVVLIGWGILSVFDSHTPGSAGTIPIGIVLMLVGLFGVGLKIVPPGTVGVVVTAGVVNNDERQPGISWVMPFIDDIKVFDVRVQAFHFENVGAASREYQDVFLTGTVNYHIDQNGAAELYQQVGDDYAQKLIVPFFNDLVKEVVPQYGVADVLPKREEIRSRAVELLREKMAPYGITIDDIALSQIDFNEEYNLAIQNKQIQELQIQTERNILEQRRVQAEQNRVTAQGEANATIERAKGEAESNRLIAESLTQPILTQMAIDKFNPNVKIVLMPPSEDGGSQFIFPPEMLTEDAPAQ